MGCGQGIVTVQSNQFCAVQKAEMCSPSCKIVQSKICALNFHTNQQQKLFCHLLHLQRWQVGAGNLVILQAGRVCFADLQRLTQFPGIQVQRKPVTHLSISSIFDSEANTWTWLPRLLRPVLPVINC